MVYASQEQEELKRQSQLQQQHLSYQTQQYRSSFPPKLGSPIGSPHDAPPLPNSPPPLFRHQGSTSPQKSPVSPPQSSPVKPKPDRKTVSFNETVDTSEPLSSSPVDSNRAREDANVRKYFDLSYQTRLVLPSFERMIHSLYPVELS